MPCRMKNAPQQNQEEDVDMFRNENPSLFVHNWDELDQDQRTDEKTKWDSMTVGQKRSLAQVAAVAYGEKMQQQQMAQGTHV